MAEDRVRVTLTYATTDDITAVVLRVFEALAKHGDAAYELVEFTASSFIETDHE